MATTVPRRGNVLPSASTSARPRVALPEPGEPGGGADGAGDAEVFPLADREVGLDRVHLRDGREQRRRPDQVADLGAGDGGDAVDERGDAGEAEVQLGALDRRLRRGLRRLRRVAGAEVVVQLTLRDGALLGERPIAREIALALGELRAGFGEARLRLAERRFERPAIDLEQQLALPDERAFPIGAAHQVAGHLRPDLGVDEAVERGDPFTGNRDALRRDGDHRHRGRRRRCRRRRILVAAAGGTRAGGGDEQSEEEPLHGRDTFRRRLGAPTPESTRRMTRRTQSGSSGSGHSRSRP